MGTGPPVDDEAPGVSVLTGYDVDHLVTYLRLLDAHADGACWADVAREVLCINPDGEPERAWRAWESHMARANWMSTIGYLCLIHRGAVHRSAGSGVSGASTPHKFGSSNSSVVAPTD
jgi:hypothetical protein